MKVVFAVNNSCIVTANFVACHGGNLVERAELPTDPQTMRVHVDIVAAHDFFHRLVLKFNFVLDLLFHCLFPSVISISGQYRYFLQKLKFYLLLSD